VTNALPTQTPTGNQRESADGCPVIPSRAIKEKNQQTAKGHPHVVCLIGEKSGKLENNKPGFLSFLTLKVKCFR
jgi:hypothetical protein